MMRNLVKSFVFLVLGVIGASGYSPLHAQEMPSPAATPFEYRIGSGDVLEIFVYENPELYRELTVRPDGVITVPLIGEVAVKGLKPMELVAELEKRFSKYIRSPVVTVNVVEAKSFSVLIRGEINSPGAYSYSEGMTLLHLIAVAGDFTPYANKGKIMVVRGTGDDKQVLRVKLKSIDENYEPFYLRPGDVVIVED